MIVLLILLLLWAVGATVVVVLLARTVRLAEHRDPGAHRTQLRADAHAQWGSR